MSDNLYKTDTNAVVRFYEQADKNNFLSEQEGHPVFDTVLMAEVITPGLSAGTLEVEIERVFNEAAGLGPKGERKIRRTSHYKRFNAQVEAYKTDSGEYIDDGTPIKSWPQIDTGTAQTLISRGIFTVEALASVADSALGSLGIGGRSLRDKANAFIVSRQFGIPTAQQSAENTKLKVALENAQSEINELKKLISEIKPDTSAKAPVGKQSKTVQDTAVTV